MRKYKEKGFTLVELIVVIAIVAVLAGVLMLAINPAALLAKSRDAKRLEDLDTLNKALTLALAEGEMTLQDVTDSQSDVTATAVDGTGYIPYTVPTGKTGLSKYIPALPLDPSQDLTVSPPLVYTFNSCANSTSCPTPGGVPGWEISGALESVDYQSRNSTDGGNNAGLYEIGTNLNLGSAAT